MDLAHWGFRRWPFERSFAADRFFAGQSHEEAMARLLFLVEESRRAGILIGPSGSGKTYLLTLVQQRATRMGRLVVRLDATGLDGHELISEIANGCNLDCDPDATASRQWNALQKRFEALAVVQHPVVIMFDHFDDADFRCHQTVCRLRQLGDSTGMKLTIVLAMRHQFIPAALQDIVELRTDLSSWGIAETARFIEGALQQSGSTRHIFTEEATDLIHEMTNGVPAHVVTLCNLALLAARGRDELVVTKQIVEAAHDELMPSPIMRSTSPIPLDEHSTISSWM